MEYVKTYAKEKIKEIVDYESSGDTSDIDILISKNIGKGLIDLQSFKKQIDSQGVFNPYIKTCGQTIRFNNTQLHLGVDYGNYMRENTMVQAPLDGEVVDVGYAASGYGQYTVVKHHKHLFSKYGHLEKGSVTVKVGEKVKKGTVTLAKMGNTGMGKPESDKKTGMHIHSEMRYTILGENKPVFLDAEQVNIDLKRFNGDIDKYLSSPLFKQRLEQKLETYNDYAKDAKGAKNVKYLSGQIENIKKALRKL